MGRSRLNPLMAPDPQGLRGRWSRFLILLVMTWLGIVLWMLGGGTAEPAVIWPDPDWPVASPAAVGLNEADLLAARDFALAQGGGSGLIIREGYQVLAWGNQAALYDLKSTSKSIGVSALGLALADGLIASIEDPAATYYPDVGRNPSSNDPAWLADLTLKHLATHAGGFDKPGSYVDLFYEPGSQWVYSDGGANWLADTLTYLFAQDLRDLMFARLFTPIGITGQDLSWRENIYRDEIWVGGAPIENREFGSGIFANVGAMARFGYLYLREGSWNGRQLVPRDFVREVTRYQPELAGLGVPTVLPNGQSPIAAYGAKDHYGISWWTNADLTMANVPADAYWGWGLNESLIVVIPSLGLVAARAGGGWQNGWVPDYAVIEPFIESLAMAAANGPALPTPTPTPAAGSCQGGVQEAEYGRRGGAFVVGGSVQASQGGYVHTPPDSGPPPPGTISGNPHRVDYCFSVTKPGMYELRGSLRLAAAGSGALFVTIDGWPADPDGIRWVITGGSGGPFIGQVMRDNGSPLPERFPLLAGQHAIALYAGDWGVQVDTLALEWVAPLRPTTVYLPLVSSP